MKRYVSKGFDGNLPEEDREAYVSFISKLLEAKRNDLNQLNENYAEFIEKRTLGMIDKNQASELLKPKRVISDNKKGQKKSGKDYLDMIRKK